MNLSSYFSALKKVKAVHEEISEQEKVLNETVKQLDNKYYDQINSLKNKIRDLEYEEETEKARLNTDYKNSIQKTKEANQSHYDTIKQTDKIFKLMGIFLFGVTRDDHFSIASTHEACHVIADDLYKIVSVHIANNRKPKNRYSLILSVQSVFKGFEDLFHWNTESILRDGTTKESLLAWYEKNKNTILVPIKRAEYKPITEFLKEHELIEQEYEQAKALYETSKEWQLAYWKDQKKYYEEQVSQGTSSEHYTGILEMIKIIQTPDLLLPTLFPLKSELGRYAFDKRCDCSHD
jgi:hypothetical protein